MRKPRQQKGMELDPEPFQNLASVHYAISQLLLLGFKVPWKFREFALKAEEDIYRVGLHVGAHKRGYRTIKEPTKADLALLDFCWKDDVARELSKEEVERGDLQYLFSQRQRPMHFPLSSSYWSSSTSIATRLSLIAIRRGNLNTRFGAHYNRFAFYETLHGQAQPQPKYLIETPIQHGVTRYPNLALIAKTPKSFLDVLFKVGTTQID